MKLVLRTNYDIPTERPNNRQIDMWVHGKVTLSLTGQIFFFNITATLLAVSTTPTSWQQEGTYQQFFGGDLIKRIVYTKPREKS